MTIRKILITGGLGYIGGRLATHLHQHIPGIDITLTTRKIMGRRFPVWSEPFTIAALDLSRRDSINNCLKDRNFDVLIHLAAMNEIDSMKNPQKAWNVNSEGTYYLLETARQKNIQRIVYFSTFHVYGQTQSETITENCPTRPFHPYAITHRAAEDWVNYFSHYHELKTLILRLSNGYGYPCDKEITRWSLVVNDLCRQAVKRHRIILRSDGTTHRDFIALYDVAEAVRHFLYSIPERWGDGIFNLCSSQSTSVKEIATRIANLFQSRYGGEKLTIEYGPASIVDMQPFSLSNDKLIRTGFRLKGDFKKEVIKTMELCEKF